MRNFIINCLFIQLSEEMLMIIFLRGHLMTDFINEDIVLIFLSELLFVLIIFSSDKSLLYNIINIIELIINLHYFFIIKINMKK